jgi:hypothetical protein
MYLEPLDRVFETEDEATAVRKSLCLVYYQLLIYTVHEVGNCLINVTTQTILIAYLRGKYLHQVEQLTGIASHSYIPDLWEYLPP